MKLEGLPEGVECVRIGVAKPDEFELHGSIIEKGPRSGSTSQIIVKPAFGWFFHYDAGTINYIPVKLIEPTEIKATVTFRVTNSRDKANIEALFARLKELPGYVEES